MAKKSKRGGEPPKKYGKYSPDEFRKHLSELEALHGSQKEAAKKLGVDVSTYRAIKTGKRTPGKQFTQKANRVYGRNRSRITEDVKAKVTKRETTREKKSKATTNKYAVVTVSTREWLRSQFDETTQEHFIINHLDGLSPYVSYPRGDPSRVQFWDGMSPIGKPPGQTILTVWGLYHTKYQIERGDIEDGTADIYSDPFPILVDLTKSWDLDRTLNYLEKKLMNHEYQTGRRRYTLTRFVGYELR